MKLYTTLFAEERRDQILQMLSDNSKILVSEVCEVFDVSPATIRGDLRDLESEGKIKRTHGGAIPVGKAMFEPDSTHKEVENIQEKQSIAQFAAGLVEDGDTIALDTGTTTFELAKCLGGKKNLTVMTNDVKIVLHLESHTDANIILLGGTLRRGFHCTTGPMSVAALSGINVDKAFMATNAFSFEKGFTTPGIDQAEMKKAMIQVASEIIVVMDSTKIGRIAFLKFANLTDIDKLVTDERIGKKTIQTFKEANDALELFVV